MFVNDVSPLSSFSHHLSLSLVLPSSYYSRGGHQTHTGSTAHLSGEAKKGIQAWMLPCLEKKVEEVVVKSPSKGKDASGSSESPSKKGKTGSPRKRDSETKEEEPVQKKSKRD
jgi:hypothetical protein